MTNYVVEAVYPTDINKILSYFEKAHPDIKIPSQVYASTACKTFGSVYKNYGIINGIMNVYSRTEATAAGAIVLKAEEVFGKTEPVVKTTPKQVEPQEPENTSSEPVQKKLVKKPKATDNLSVVFKVYSSASLDRAVQYFRETYDKNLRGDVIISSSRTYVGYIEGSFNSYTFEEVKESKATLLDLETKKEILEVKKTVTMEEGGKLFEVPEKYTDSLEGPDNLNRESFESDFVIKASLQEDVKHIFDFIQEVRHVKRPRKFNNCRKCIRNSQEYLYGFINGVFDTYTREQVTRLSKGKPVIYLTADESREILSKFKEEPMKKDTDKKNIIDGAVKTVSAMDTPIVVDTTVKKLTTLDRINNTVVAAMHQSEIKAALKYFELKGDPDTTGFLVGYEAHSCADNSQFFFYGFIDGVWGCYSKGLVQLHGNIKVLSHSDVLDEIGQDITEPCVAPSESRLASILKAKAAEYISLEVLKDDFVIHIVNRQDIRPAKDFIYKARHLNPEEVHRTRAYCQEESDQFLFGFINGILGAYTQDNIFEARIVEGNKVVKSVQVISMSAVYSIIGNVDFIQEPKVTPNLKGSLVINAQIQAADTGDIVKESLLMLIKNNLPVHPDLIAQYNQLVQK